jgi:hypothetical protein
MGSPAMGRKDVRRCQRSIPPSTASVSGDMARQQRVSMVMNECVLVEEIYHKKGDST